MLQEISNLNEQYLSPTVFEEIFAEENRGTIKYFDKVRRLSTPLPDSVHRYD